ncbi:MAG: hypothetical protein KIT79_10035 [Deltaproteobacteria bacterium]|nr:hypothetical protein [Deltaproteobacteria bacterium]
MTDDCQILVVKTGAVWDLPGGVTMAFEDVPEEIESSFLRQTGLPVSEKSLLVMSPPAFTGSITLAIHEVELTGNCRDNAGIPAAKLPRIRYMDIADFVVRKDACLPVRRSLYSWMKEMDEFGMLEDD